MKYQRCRLHSTSCTVGDIIVFSMHRPNLCFTPDHLLTVRTDLLDGQGMNDATLEAKLRAVDELAELRDVSIAEQGVDTVVSIPIDELAKTRDGALVMSGCDALIRNLIHITPFRADPTVDRFFGLMHGAGCGPRFTVYRSAQDWLDIHPFTELETTHVLTAMYAPYHSMTLSGVSPSTTSYTSFDKSSISERDGISLTIREERFGHGIRHASPNLRTLGDCACLGATGADRTAIETRPDRAHLYNITPHNVDTSRQTLSFILGIGALTEIALRELTE